MQFKRPAFAGRFYAWVLASIACEMPIFQPTPFDSDSDLELLQSERNLLSVNFDFFMATGLLGT